MKTNIMVVFLSLFAISTIVCLTMYGTCRVPGVIENFAANAGLDNNGEMLMFANTEFKPECCPNTYTTGGGCACMSASQRNLLNTRGGNNYPFSEY